MPCFVLFSAACSTDHAALRRGRDVYPDFASLKAANTEGLDYSREVYNRGSRIAVFAIHGGDIETATARIARRVAGKDFNLYIFNGWKDHGSADLHITAAHFDDPEAVGLAAASALGISVHGQADHGSYVCVGGKNTAAAALMAKRLEDAGFAAQTPCTRLAGITDKNLVNRPSGGGVQLEITLRLLERLDKSGTELAKFSEAVRQAALEALPNVKQEGVPK